MEEGWIQASAEGRTRQGQEDVRIMDDKPFNIVDYIPELNVVGDGASGWAISGTSNYNAIVLDGPDGFVYQSEIDLAGWTREGLTAFFSNQFTQRDGPYVPIHAVITPGAVDTLEARDYIIVTDVPLQLSSTIIHAGFLDNASDYMTIKLGQANIFTQTTTAGRVMIPSDGWGFGSGEPTAAGTLYVTRICVPYLQVPTPADSIDFPAIRYVAQGIATEEPEFVYMNRLRRSYEQAQQ